jgi:hypothetical protein
MTNETTTEPPRRGLPRSDTRPARCDLVDTVFAGRSAAHTRPASSGS